MNSTALSEKYGTCQLCGGHNRRLRILVISDFIGWACDACMRQLAESLPRRYIPPTEEMEPCE